MPYKAERNFEMDKKTVGILTNFMDFNPGYSLSGIVVDQAHMLIRQGHKVIIYVNEQFNEQYNEDAGVVKLLAQFSDLLFIKQKTKFMKLNDYEKDGLKEEHVMQAKEAGTTFAQEIIDEEIKIIFTHDFIFTGWNLPYFHAIIETNQILRQQRKDTIWYHWIHSVPSSSRDWWSFEKLGLNHFPVFPNRTEIMRVAESYKIPASRVRCIPHIKDIRNWYDFGGDARFICREYPEIMNSEIIQVYPCSTDRLAAKQLHIVIAIFAFFKTYFKRSVFLVIANQWATGKQRKENVQTYIDTAEQLGLFYGKDFIFTSEADKSFATGISKRMLRELQLLSNIFIFPTREESFGLVGPEAAFSGCLPVVNRSLKMMQEVMSPMAPAFEFGSFDQTVDRIEDPQYLQSIAMAILNRYHYTESLQVKTHCRLTYNMDNLYVREYLPNL